LRYVIAAVALAIGFAPASSAWFWWLVYISFAYLWFNALMMIAAAGVLLNPDKFHGTKRDTEAYRNHMLQALVNAITGVFLFKIYMDGYVFLAGFFSFMLMVSIWSNIMTALANKKEQP
jgi:hypothetical protein